MRQPLVLLATFAAFVSLAACSNEARKTRALSRADRYFDQGDYDKAKIEYSSVLRIDQQNTKAYARLGVILLEEGSPFRAAAFLLKTRELAPDNLDNRLKLAQLFVSIGRRSDAVQEATTVLTGSPDNGAALRVLAEAAQKPEELDRLEEELRKFPKPDDVLFQLAKAMAAIRKEDQPAAEKALQRALTLNPRSSSAHYFMAAYWLWQKAPDKAGAEFKAAAELAPPRSPERLKYSEFLAQSGAIDQAVASLQTITKQTPDYLPAWNLLAELALRRKNYEESLNLLKNVLNRDAENFDANLLRAKVLLAKGDTEKATDAFERLDGKYPNFAPLKFELAQCYLKKNNSVQAIAMLNQVIAANPDSVQAILLLGQINLRSGKAQSVVDAMSALLKKNPKIFEAKLLLADALRSVGRLDDAAAIFREQIQQSPQNAQAYTALGMILRQQKKNDEALQTFEKALELAPNNQIIAAQLVDLEISTKNFDKALQVAQQQINKNPDSALGYFLEGRVYAAQGKLDAAEKSLTKALTLSRDFTAAYSLLASVYLAANKLSEGAQQLETLVAKSPNDTRALMTLGMVYEKLQEMPKARAVYEKVIALTPDFAPALNNLAYLDAEYLNEIERAYQLAHKAYELQPADASIADTLGWVLYKKRDYEQALHFLQESAAKAPNEPQILYHLGMAEYMLGERAAARTAFEQAAQSPNDFANKRDLQRHLLLLSETSASSQLSVEDLKLIVNQQPDDVIAWTRLGEAQEKQQAFKDAAASYKEAIKRNPKLEPVLFKLAELYSGPLNDSAKALEYAKDVRELSPDDARTAVLLGRIAFKAGNYGWAYSLLKQASGDLSDDPKVLHDLGWAAFSVGKIADAKENMEDVIRRSPDSAEASDARSFLAMVALHETPEIAVPSQTEVAKLLKANPDYVPAQLAQAAIEFQQGRMKAAADYYEAILKRFPEFTPAQKALARLYSRDPANADKAYELAVKARKALPDDPDMANILAEISFQRKEYSRALQLLRESASKQAPDPEHLYYFGMCAFYTKQNSQARSALDQALAAGLKDPLAADARRALQDLKN